MTYEFPSMKLFKMGLESLNQNDIKDIRNKYFNDCKKMNKYRKQLGKVNIPIIIKDDLN